MLKYWHFQAPTTSVTTLRTISTLLLIGSVCIALTVSGMSGKLTPNKFLGFFFYYCFHHLQPTLLWPSFQTFLLCSLLSDRCRPPPLPSSSRPSLTSCPARTDALNTSMKNNLLFWLLPGFFLQVLTLLGLSLCSSLAFWLLLPAPFSLSWTLWPKHLAHFFVYVFVFVFLIAFDIVFIFICNSWNYCFGVGLG